MVSVPVSPSTTTLVGGRQKVAVSYPAVQVQRICYVSGDEDLYRVSTPCRERGGFGCLGIQCLVDLLIHQAVEIQWVENVATQEEIGRQDRVALGVGPSPPLAGCWMLETRVCSVATLCQFSLLLLLGIVKGVPAIDVVLISSGPRSGIICVGKCVSHAVVFW